MPCSGNPMIPAVLAFQMGPLTLGQELERLDAVVRVEAYEGAIFYCGRILEALTSAAVESVGLESDSSIFGNLSTLEDLNLLDRKVAGYAHTVRRLCNAVRHIQRQIHAEDALVARQLLEPCLAWFFCRYPAGPRLPHIWMDPSPSVQETNGAWPRTANLPTSTPLFPTLAAEAHLAEGALEDAKRILEDGLAIFKDDLRLNQLLALYWSRRGLPERAIQILEPLECRRPDDESAGILAGAYKRIWLEDRQQTHWLEESHAHYNQQWKRSKGSPYLGINAATTALWLGRTNAAQTGAESVRKSLLARERALLMAPLAWSVRLGFWDQVSLAESELILGQFGSARRRYAEAFITDGCGVPDQCRVARRQAEVILEYMGLGEARPAFFSPPSLPVELFQPLRIGLIASTRSDTPDLEMGVETALKYTLETCDPFGTAKLEAIRVVSSLGNEAERRAWSYIKSRHAGARLELLLARDYHPALETAEDPAEQDPLMPFIAEAEVVRVIQTGTNSRHEVPSANSFDVAQAVADDCQMLMIIETKIPGTFEHEVILGHARASGRPVMRLRIGPSPGVTTERMEHLPEYSPIPQPGAHPVTYLPKPLDTSCIELPSTILNLAERLAENNHDIWCRTRLAQGWTWGAQRDDVARKTPCLVPFSELPESEKEVDRATVMGTLKAALALGCRIVD